MLMLTFISAFLATAISIVGLSTISYKYSNKDTSRSLSEIAARKMPVLNRFRVILWTSSTLFAVTIYFFIAPNIAYSLLVAAAWSLEYICVVALAIIPSKGKTKKRHALLANGMSLGMLSLAFSFWIGLEGNYALLAMYIFLAMCAFALLIGLDKKRFLLYELAFIYTSHISICVAALALAQAKF